MPTYEELRKKLLESSVAPENTAFPSQTPLKKEEGKGVVPWLLENLARPGHASMAGLDELLPGKPSKRRGTRIENAYEAVKETWNEPEEERAKHGTEQILKDRGVDFPGISVAGFIGDAVLDPLNLVAPLKITKTLGRGVRAAEKAIPALEAAKLGAARGLVRPMLSATAGMRPEVAEATRLIQAAHRTAPERTIERLFAAKIPSLNTTQLERLTENQLKSKIGELRDVEKAEDIRKWIQRQTSEKLLDRTAPSEIVKLEDVKGLDRLLQKNPDLKGIPVLRDFAENLVPRVGAIGDDNKAVDLYKRALSNWKKQVTVLNPRFHVNNALGNAWQIMAQDAGSMLTNSPAHAFNTISKGMAWQGTPQLYAKGIGKYSQKEIADALKRYGVDTGLAQHINYSPDDIKRVIDSVKAIHAPTKNPLKMASRGINKLGDFNEKGAKIGVVIKELEKGKTLDQALIAAKDALFDYQELTPGMRKLRDVGVPFLTFASKNLPLQIQNAINKPASLAMIQRGVEQGREGAKESGTFVPDNERYLSSVNNADFQTGQKGPNGESVLMRNVLPIGDLNILGALRGGVQGKAARDLIADKLGPIPQIIMDSLQKGRSNIPEAGPFGKTPTNAGAEVLLSSKFGGEKELGQRLGLERFKNKKNKNAVEYRLPWLANELMNLTIPLMNSAGRAGLAYSEPELATDPLALHSWLGSPMTALKPESRKANKKSNARQKNLLKNETKRLKKALFDDEEL